MAPRKETNARVLAAIADLTKEKGYPPTHREVGHRVGIYPSAVHHHVVRLREAGLLYAPEVRIAMGLGITPAGRKHLARCASSN